MGLVTAFNPGLTRYCGGKNLIAFSAFWTRPLILWVYLSAIEFVNVDKRRNAIHTKSDQHIF